MQKRLTQSSQSFRDYSGLRLFRWFAVREVDTSAKLNLAIVGLFVTNDSKIVFNLDACSFEPVLAIVAST